MDKNIIAVAACSFVLAGFASTMPKNVPELMTTFKGEKVSSAEEWEKVRAPELFDTFANEEYGRWPKDGSFSVSFDTAEPDVLMMGGKAVRKRICITCAGSHGVRSFVATAFIPVCKKPVPAFLFICNRNPYENIDPTRARKSGFWPAEEIVDRGYAAITFWNGDVAPDWNTGNREGVFSCFSLMGFRRRRSRFRNGACRTISAQANTISRLMTGSATWILQIAMAGESESSRIKPAAFRAEAQPR